MEDNGMEKLRQSLLRIDSNLENPEVEKLKFLCRDLVVHRKLESAGSALDVFEHLISNGQLTDEDPFLVAELLYIMKQNSLLSHLGYSKKQVKDQLPARKQVSAFRNLLYELSENIDSGSLRAMIFLLKDSLPKVQTPTSLSFLEHLEKQAKIDADDLTLLEDLCSKVLPNLVKKIEKYKREKDAKPAEKELLSASGINQLRQALPEEAVYRMDRKHRGHCVVINNRNFRDLLSERKGTDKDADYLKDVFQWLGFNVEVQVNVTKKCLDEVLQKYKSLPDHANGDCFVFCVLTHGESEHVYSSDEALIPIREIMSHFTAKQCPGLATKPKLFFIQACQGKETQSSVSIETDAVDAELIQAPLRESVPVEADFLLGLATVPGCVSFRHQKEGSWFIQSLCTYLKEMVPRNEDILSILTAVNNDVSRRGVIKKQIPQPVFTLRKKVIFPVPLREFPERVPTDP